MKFMNQQKKEPVPMENFSGSPTTSWKTVRELISINNFRWRHRTGLPLLSVKKSRILSPLQFGLTLQLGSLLQRETCSVAEVATYWNLVFVLCDFKPCMLVFVSPMKSMKKQRRNGNEGESLLVPVWLRDGDRRFSDDFSVWKLHIAPRCTLLSRFSDRSWSLEVQRFAQRHH